MHSTPPPPPHDGSAVLPWVRGLAAGDEDALGPWYELEYPVIYRLCLGFLASQADAEDAAQDAMLQLARKIGLWQPNQPYGPWRNSVVANLCRDRLRAQGRREFHEREAMQRRGQRSVAATPEPDWQETICQALAWLSPRERECFVLVDLEGHGAEQAGQQLGLAASSVRAHLSAARRKLRSQLEPLGPEEQA
ncbi:MAG: sigma-70 family RNA polymerase sigma factor [Planctomycetota bacterium]